MYEKKAKIWLYEKRHDLEKNLNLHSKFDTTISKPMTKLC